MTFEEAYSALEDDFRQRVEEDKQSGVKCIFLPNVEPIGPVDYVLVGMEPSLGRWGSTDMEWNRLAHEDSCPAPAGVVHVKNTTFYRYRKALHTESD